MPGKCALTRMICPETSDPTKKWFCPMFWTTVATDIASGKQEVIRSCGAGQLQTYMIEVIKASNRPAAAIESTRNEIVRGFTALASAAHQGLLERQHEDDHNPGPARAALAPADAADPPGEHRSEPRGGNGADPDTAGRPIQDGA